MRRRRMLYAIIFIEVIVFIGIAGIYLCSQANRPNLSTDQYQNLPEISVAELAKYDGTNPELPIYVAVNGLVYDVTAGRKFYETGGTYHFVAGKDATADLGPFATAITGKYPIIKKLIH